MEKIILMLKTCKCKRDEDGAGQVVALPIYWFSVPYLLALCFTENINLVKALVHLFFICF